MWHLRGPSELYVKAGPSTADEAARLEWLATHGIPVAEIVDRDTGWLVTRALPGPAGVRQPSLVWSTSGGPGSRIVTSTWPSGHAASVHPANTQFGPSMAARFLDTYGVPEPDETKIAFYRLLDGFT